MPFNVNAVTHLLLGILFANTVFALYQDPKDEETIDLFDFVESKKTSEEENANEKKTKTD